MTASSDRSKLGKSAGFTFVELMIAASLGTIILAAVLTTFIMIARSGVRVVNYSAMETQTRNAFEQLAMDARMANIFTDNPTSGGITSFTLSIPKEDLSSSHSVTYGYDESNAADKKFFVIRETGVRRDLITNLDAFAILRYDAAGALILNNVGMKHLQISVSVRRSGTNVVATTQVIRSTAFTLRNM